MRSLNVDIYSPILLNQYYFLVKILNELCFTTRKTAKGKATSKII